jgi:hypothetical protein
MRRLPAGSGSSPSPSTRFERKSARDVVGRAGRLLSGGYYTAATTSWENQVVVVDCRLDVSFWGQLPVALGPPVYLTGEVPALPPENRPARRGGALVRRAVLWGCGFCRTARPVGCRLAIGGGRSRRRPAPQRSRKITFRNLSDLCFSHAFDSLRLG